MLQSSPSAASLLTSSSSMATASASIGKGYLSNSLAYGFLYLRVDGLVCGIVFGFFVLLVGILRETTLAVFCTFVFNFLLEFSNLVFGVIQLRLKLRYMVLIF